MLTIFMELFNPTMILDYQLYYGNGYASNLDSSQHILTEIFPSVLHSV
jgi:hypothetical protein